MYLPPAFAEPDPTVLHAVMRRHGFALLVTVLDGTPVATHLPLLLDAERGPHGTLWGHLARPNHQWQGFGPGESLAVFQGPHAYVSPTWYTSAPAVPTWNYVAVHAYGTPQVVDDPAAIRAGLDRLTAVYEGDGPGAYRPDWGIDFTTNLAKGIVAFELPISRLEGKFKLSQNRSEADQAAVAARLAAAAEGDERALGVLMAERQRRQG